MAMIQVYWAEQSESDLPARDEWLSEREAATLATLRFPDRRRDWRLGRWTAKLAVAGLLRMRDDLRTIEIAGAPSGAPEVYLANGPAEINISITHRGGTAACAAAFTKCAIGCDLEIVEPHSEAFVRDYFTIEEQAAISAAALSQRNQLISLLWSGKESALKAVGTGLRLDTREVVICVAEPSGPPCDWSALYVTRGSLLGFTGWWSREGDLIRTLVSAPPPFTPQRLTPIGTGRLQMVETGAETLSVV